MNSKNPNHLALA